MAKKIYGSVEELRNMLWESLIRIHDRVRNAPDDFALYKAVHAQAQAAAQYIKACEVTDFDLRLKALENARIADAYASFGTPPRTTHSVRGSLNGRPQNPPGDA